MPSAANLSNLKDDLEEFNNYLGVNEEKGMGLRPTSNVRLPSVGKLPAAEEGEAIKALKEENVKLKQELEEIRFEFQKVKEEEIANWEKELTKEKELFKSYRQEKEELGNERVVELERKLRESEEKVVELERKLKESEEKTVELERKLRESEEKVVELERKVRESEEKLKGLNSEVSDLKLKQTQKLQSLSQSHEKEVQSLQELLKSAKGQTERLEALEREKAKIESDLKRVNEDFEKERKFMENEVKLVEEMAVSAKMQFAEVSMDRDRFQFKYQKALKEAKKFGVELKV